MRQADSVVLLVLVLASALAVKFVPAMVVLLLGALVRYRKAAK